MILKNVKIYDSNDKKFKNGSMPIANGTIEKIAFDSDELSVLLDGEAI